MEARNHCPQNPRKLAEWDMAQSECTPFTLGTLFPYRQLSLAFWYFCFFGFMQQWTSSWLLIFIPSQKFWYQLSHLMRRILWTEPRANHMERPPLPLASHISNLKIFKSKDRSLPSVKFKYGKESPPCSSWHSCQCLIVLNKAKA